MKRVWSLFSAVGIALVVMACSDSGDGDNEAQRLKQETGVIDDYLTGKNITAVKDPSGVRVVIYKLGTGFPAKGTSTVSVDYTGRFFPDGVTFDEGTTEGVVKQYIRGWQIALSLLPEGSRARVYIPSLWAYGTNGSGSIPGNTILEFDVEFNKLARTSAELTQLASDTVAIDQYLSGKGIVPLRDTTGLRYVITQQGGGAIPTLYNKLKFGITYRLMSDDTKVIADFDNEPSTGFDNRAVDQVADGVKKVLTSVPVGTKATLYLPSLLGFGTQGAANNGAQVVPANANIIVDIELKEIVTP